jgi:antitoxin VapB
MGLNIKNAGTERLIRELADATGETMTGAVTEAVRERLARVRRDPDEPGMSGQILAVGADIRSRLPDDFFDVEHGELLYDEAGLPR